VNRRALSVALIVRLSRCVADLTHVSSRDSGTVSGKARKLGGRYTEVAPMLLLLLTPWVLFKIFTASLLPSVLLR
jgi:hypothetical protein